MFRDVLNMIEAIFEGTQETKTVGKCQKNNFVFGLFECVYRELGDQELWSIGFSGSATQIQKMQIESDVFRAMFEQDRGRIMPRACNKNRRGTWGLQFSYWSTSRFIHEFWR